MFFISQKIIDYFEGQTVPFRDVVFTYFAAIILRLFFESFSQGTIDYFNLPPPILLINFTHFTIAYCSGTISLLLLLYYATRQPVQQIARLVLPCFIILLLPPIIDLISNGGRGHDMFYLSFPTRIHPLKQFFTFFGDDPGITIGMRIEIALVLYGIFNYVYIKRKKWSCALMYTFIAYQIIFIYCAFPLVLQSLSIDTHEHFSLTMVRFYAFFIFFTGSWLAYLANKTVFLALIKDLRWLRIFHYQLMVLFGVALACDYSHFSFYQFFMLSTTDGSTHFIFCMISILFVGLFSIVTNNLADQTIDRVSNPERPLMTGAIDPRTYAALGYTSLALGLGFAFLAGEKAFVLLAVVTAAYYIYSVPPIRFKRVPFFSKLIISMNSLALILLGFLLVTDHVNGFPLALVPIYLIGFTLSANLIDLKDHAGDKAGNVITLPGLLGLKKAKQLIGWGFFFTYLSFYFLLLNVFWLPVLTIAGGIQVYLINRKNYQEALSFGFYLINMMAVIFFLMLLSQS